MSGNYSNLLEELLWHQETMRRANRAIDDGEATGEVLKELNEVLKFLQDNAADLGLITETIISIYQLNTMMVDKLRKLEGDADE